MTDWCEPGLELVEPDADRRRYIRRADALRKDDPAWQEVFERCVCEHIALGYLTTERLLERETTWRTPGRSEH